MRAPIHFLLIDDDPEINFFNEITIRHADGDSEIITFTNPKEGLDFIERTYLPNENRHTVLLLDINMPERAAWNFLEKFNELPQTIQRQFDNYILSSSVNNGRKKIAETYPAIKGYIEKPLSRKMLEKLYISLP